MWTHLGMPRLRVMYFVFGVGTWASLWVLLPSYFFPSAKRTFRCFFLYKGLRHWIRVSSPVCGRIRIPGDSKINHYHHRKWNYSNMPGKYRWRLKSSGRPRFFLRFFYDHFLVSEGLNKVDISGQFFVLGQLIGPRWRPILVSFK